MRRELLAQLEPPVLDLHGATWVSRERYELRADARRFELWESNLAAKRGLAAAVDYALGLGLDPIAVRIAALANRLRATLEGVEGVRVRDLGPPRCGIVSFTREGHSPDELCRRLGARGVNASVSPAHYTRVDMERRSLDAVVRLSPRCYYFEEEIDAAVDALKS